MYICTYISLYIYRERERYIWAAHSGGATPRKRRRVFAYTEGPPNPLHFAISCFSAPLLPKLRYMLRHVATRGAVPKAPRRPMIGQGVCNTVRYEQVGGQAVFLAWLQKMSA